MQFCFFFLNEKIGSFIRSIIFMYIYAISYMEFLKSLIFLFIAILSFFTSKNKIKILYSYFSFIAQYIFYNILQYNV